MTEQRDVVAVGASAGGVEALRALVADLPPDYPGVLLVVLHVPPSAPTALPGILDRNGPLTATAAIDGEPVRPGHIYVAPSDHHLLVLDGRLRLSHGPAENGHRPGIDPLFRSVAHAFGPRAVGVVLSGTRDDGAAGLAAIAAQGGTTIVQDPADALHPWMPRAAITHVTPDHIVPAAKMGHLLASLVPDLTAPPPDPLLEAEVAIADLAPVTTDGPSYGCPDCGGSLFIVGNEPIPRFRCRVGHAWSPESLLDEQANVLEGALWMALRALEEKAALSLRMAESRQSVHSATGARFTDMAADARVAAGAIRALIDRIGTDTTADLGEPGVGVR